MSKPDIHDGLSKRRTSGILDHFNNYTDGGLWTKGGIGGTVAMAAAPAGGMLTLTTGAVQSNTAFVATTNKVFLFALGQPMIFQTAINYTEANVNQAGIFAGFASAMTGILTAITGVPLNPCSACGIFKKPGDVLWSAFTSIAGVQMITQSKSSCILAGAAQELTLQVMIQGSNIETTFWVGGPGATTITGGGPTGPTAMFPNVTNMGTYQPIKHVIPILSAVAMFGGVNVLAGSASSEVVNVNYIGTEFLCLP